MAAVPFGVTPEALKKASHEFHVRLEIILINHKIVAESLWLLTSTQDESKSTKPEKSRGRWLWDYGQTVEKRITVIAV